MRRLVPAVIPPITVVGLLLSGLGHTAVSVEDTAGPENQVANSPSEAGNSSIRATITITMTGVLDE